MGGVNGNGYGRGRGQPPIEWSLIVHSYWCRDCDAEPGSHCMTRNGKPKSEPHIARMADVNRCERCTAWLHADWPEAYCPRCMALLHRDY